MKYLLIVSITLNFLFLIGNVILAVFLFDLGPILCKMYKLTKIKFIDKHATTLDKCLHCKHFDTCWRHK